MHEQVHLRLIYCPSLHRLQWRRNESDGGGEGTRPGAKRRKKVFIMPLHFLGDQKKLAI